MVNREIIYFSMLQNNLVSKNFVKSETLCVCKKQVFIIIMLYYVQVMQLHQINYNSIGFSEVDFCFCF